MKNIFLAVSIILTVAFASSFTVLHAATAGVFDSCSTNPSLSNTTVCKDANKATTGDPIVSVIRSVIEVLSIIIGIAAVIGIIVSGLRMTLANGDSNGIASARSSLVYSLVGLAVAALAQVIVRIVLGSVG